MQHQAQTLHDFVLSLLRDPTARAAFDADPETVLQEAGLGDITALDVQETIPLVLDYASVPGVDGIDTGLTELPTDTTDTDLSTAIQQLQLVTQQLTGQGTAVKVHGHTTSDLADTAVDLDGSGAGTDLSAATDVADVLDTDTASLTENLVNGAVANGVSDSLQNSTVGLQVATASTLASDYVGTVTLPGATAGVAAVPGASTGAEVSVPADLSAATDVADVLDTDTVNLEGATTDVVEAPVDEVVASTGDALDPLADQVQSTLDASLAPALDAVNAVNAATAPALGLGVQTGTVPGLDVTENLADGVRADLPTDTPTTLPATDDLSGALPSGVGDVVNVVNDAATGLTQTLNTGDLDLGL